MKRVLITGFKPFLGEKKNPSEEIIKAISLKQNFYLEKNILVETVLLPVEFKTAFLTLKEFINSKEIPFDFVFMIGQASGREGIHLEKIALNWVQTTSADEGGYTPEIGSIDKNAELALMTTIEVDQLVQKLNQAQIKAQVSFSAGTFVCNYLYYLMLKSFSQQNSLFIHVPLLPEQIVKSEKSELEKSELESSLLSDESSLNFNDVISEPNALYDVSRLVNQHKPTMPFTEMLKAVELIIEEC